MKLLMRKQVPSLQDRLVWQSASLLLAYPDRGRFDIADELLAHLDGGAADLLGHAAGTLHASDPMRAAIDYVDTFDLRRRCTMYLTYWTAGDTRNRGAAMLEFAAAYRQANVEPPSSEAPDYLPVVLEFAATVDPEAGRRLLAEHRMPIEVLREALSEMASPYAYAVAAVCNTLPAATEIEVNRAQHLAQAGPPAEAVGLQPFTLTVPPRRSAGGG